MLQFKTISTTCRNIVEKFISGSIFSQKMKKKQLVASLYSLLDNSDAEIVNCLTSYVINLGEFLSTDEISLLKKESMAVFRYCHNRKLDVGFTHLSDNHLMTIPQSLMDLCNEMLDTNKNSEVFLPYASAIQLAFSKQECKYEGFVPNSETWAFYQIYLYAYEINADIKCTAKMSDALTEGKQYNIIFSFSLFLKGRGEQSVIDNLYDLATKSLKDNGTMCCILPLNFCTDGYWFAIRKILMDYRNQYSAAVISLPHLVFSYPSVNFCIFILHRDGQGNIMLVDATSDNFCAQHDVPGHKSYVLKPQSIIETIKSADEKHVWVGTINDLSDYLNLTPSRYLVEQQMPSLQRNGMKSLGELINLIDSEYIELPDAGCKYVDVKSMSTNYLRSDIIDSKIQTISPLQNARVSRLADNQSLLFAFRGRKALVGKLTDFTNNDIIAISRHILPFKIKENSPISEDYLLRCLLSKEVEQQMLMLNGSSSEKTQIDDFLSLRIYVPTLEEQDKICKEDSRVSLSEADRKLLESAETFRRDIHMKKHAIGQTVFNLNNWWKTLLRAREEGNGVVNDSAIIGRSQKIAVKEIYANIQQTLEQLQQQINKFDRGHGLTIGDIALTSFIEDYISKHKSPLFRFEYDADSHYGYKSKNGNIFYTRNINKINNFNFTKEEHEVALEHAVFAPEALTIIFDNIVSNACSHGFVSSEEKADDNIIKIELYTQGKDHVIEISNNGKPVREDVTEEYVFTYNKSTQSGRYHYGIGGYEIKRLMQEFDGDAEFISRPSEDFSVTYKLIFHNIGIEEIDIFDELNKEEQ